TVPVTFIFMTGHANGGGEGDSSDSRNVQIRNHCLAYNRVLFDFSDIENYDPDNNYYLDKLVDDALYYDSNGDSARDSNWASEYLTAHPGSENYKLIYGDGGSYSGFQESCAHSPEGGETNDATLNCVLKGKAVWWMLAGIAGWDSDCASYNPATGVLHIPYLVFGGQSYWLEFNVTEQGLVLGNFGPSKGTGACATWTGSVLQIDCLAVDDSGATYWLNLAPSGSNWVLGSFGTN
ncbi:MAG: hypothetical protein GY850_44835, partial [bacterium]|nr:hypothetical protein [bacterium]